MSRSAATFILAGVAAHFVAADDFMPYIYYDNQEFLANSSNIARISWKEVEAAFEHPDHVDTADYSGFDWTKPFPGSPIDGFQAHLRIANDVPWPEVLVRNQSTEVSALTFSIPEPLMDTAKGLPKAIDPSWAICQHYFVSARPDPTEAIDHSCGFLPAECRAELESSLTGSWFQTDPDVSCSSFALDPVPPSCQGTLGRIRADVISWGSEAFDDDFTAKYLAVDQINEATWMLGTGFVDVGNETAYYDASNRTFIVGTVFGYSRSIEQTKKQTPKLSLACLRPEWVPPAKPTSTTTTFSITSVGYSTETATEVITTGLPSTQPITTPTPTTITGPVCVSGTTSPNRSGGDFQELCEFSCAYGFCPPTACQCLDYSSEPKVAPSTNGLEGCALEGVTDDDYKHLCSFACSHGTCPEAVCMYC